MREALLLLVLAGCGRVGFNPLGEIDSGPGDSGSGSGSGSGCGAGPDHACSSSTLSLSNNTTGNGGNDLIFFANNLTGSCGGAVGGDYGFTFIVLQAGDYEFTLTASFDSVLYALDGMTCAGAELACVDNPGTGDESITLSLAANQRINVVIDSASGCGEFSLSYRGL